MNNLSPAPSEFHDHASAPVAFAEKALEASQLRVAYRSYNQRPSSLKETVIRFFKTGSTKHFSTFDALHNVTFEVAKGEVFGIIGGNGSGKSTLLKVLSGVLAPTSGSIRTTGTIASLIELGAGFDPELTAIENIYLHGSLHKKTRKQMRTRIESIISFAELHDFANTPIKYYSSGMYARLGFSCAVDIDPDILLVDEILGVGDARFQEKCVGVFNAFLQAKKTIVLVSHDLETLRRLASRVMVLSKGQSMFLGEPNQAIDFYQSPEYQGSLS